ncbi:MAG: neutral/alkaline non-lysosomal ceramidase N-terminal domain-containing protein [Chitinophagales bacterium]|nr:neutral/alkaline non-lysosomal ceramidase N-terminal domain-containing protein [Chitinophagales bacterium]
MYEIGTGKAEITAFKKGVGMMGYGVFPNKVERVETPLSARAFVFKDISSNKKIAFVNCEICFITISIKRGVHKKLKRHHAELGYELDNLFLTAQHTHSGPGGYSHYGFYNISTPGFVPEVYQTIVEGIVAAIVQAEKNMKPGRILVNRGAFAPDIDVAFNRSIKAYNSNPEVKVKLKDSEANIAIDREMLMLRMEGLDDQPIGAINFFGVHTTSVHNDNRSICFDNKGYAAQYHEEELKDKSGFISIFAQKIAGDVTPNYVWDKKKKWTRGPFEDNFESAKYNGKLQYNLASKLFTEALGKETVNMGIDYALSYANLSNITVDTDFANGRTDARTGPSCHGVAFFKGTKEGPGMPPALSTICSVASDLVKTYEQIRMLFINKKEREKIKDKYRIQGKKKILVETGERRVLAALNIGRVVVPAFVDPSIYYFKYFYKTGGLDHKPWIPQTLPLHIVTLGQIAFVGIPGEITTIAGKRLQQTIHNELKEKGITEVVICSYANAYCGYITTNEEYQLQCYEGGHTVYGEWTLAAFQTKFKQLAKEMLKQPNERFVDTSELPIEFTEEELKKRTFSEA